MRRHTSRILSRFVEKMSALLALRHRDLARAMVAELDAIEDPAERRRFALGAIVAIVWIALRRHSAPTVAAPDRCVGIPEPVNNSNPRGPSMPTPTARQLLRRHVTPFAVTFAGLTALLLANFGARQLPQLRARGVSAGTVFEALLLAMPFTMALTIPMAVFLAVSWVFTRLGLEGVLATTQREGILVRRLVGPVLGVAAVIAALTFVSNTQLLPRSNARLATVLAGASMVQTDRSMTLSELRGAAQRARNEARPDATARAVAYEVEIQKKFALAAACLVLALAGATITLRFPRGGVGLVIGAGGVVFTGYYLALVAGETLADQQIISPFVAMWMGNAILLAVVPLLVWRAGGNGGVRNTETLAIGG